MAKDILKSKDELFNLALSVKNISDIVGMESKTYWDNHLTEEERNGFSWEVVKKAMDIIPEEMANLSRIALVHKLLQGLSKTITA